MTITKQGFVKRVNRLTWALILQIFGGILIISSLTGMAGLLFKPSTTSKVTHTVYTTIPIKLIQPTLSNAVWWIKYYQVKYPRIAYRQLCLESGNMTSRVFLHNRNCFGMNYPRNRPTTAITNNGRWAVYSDYMSSIEDYKLYQDYIGVKDGWSEYQYCLYLQEHKYWEDSLYINKLMK